MDIRGSFGYNKHWFSLFLTKRHQIKVETAGNKKAMHINKQKDDYRSIFLLLLQIGIFVIIVCIIYPTKNKWFTIVPDIVIKYTCVSVPSDAKKLWVQI